MIDRKAAESIEEGARIPQPIWARCLYDILSSVSGGKKDVERNEDMKILLNMFSNNGVVIFVDHEKERPYVQSCVEFLRSLFFSLSRGGCWNTSYLNYL